MAFCLMALLFSFSCAAAENTTTYRFSDINLEVQVPSELIGFTRSVTSNNAYLDLIGTDDVEELRSLMVVNHVYLEAVPQDVRYELIISGKEAGSASTDFTELSDTDLDSLFNEYLQKSDAIDNESVTENITASAIEHVNGIPYFVTSVKSVANNQVTVYMKKYYTVMQGNAISFFIQSNGEEIDSAFVNDLTKISLSKEAIQRHHDMKIVYTPIHGTGVKLIPRALAAFGFTNIIHVPEQDVVSGDFPTVVSPNPEEPAALSMAVEKAKETDAELVLASDPDADRVGAAVKNNEGEWVLLNGNQTALMFVYYLITRWKELGKIQGKEYIVKTIVTTETIKTIADRNGVGFYDVYTGFKWIANVMKQNEGKLNYIGGGEESYGFLCEDFVRDKDAVSACAVLAEIAAWAKDQGMSMYQLLQKIYVEYGFSKEKGISVVKKGKSGAEEIEAMMKHFRENPLKEIAGSKVTYFYDYSTLKGIDYLENETLTLDMPVTSNVLQFFTEDGTKVSIRPSGTEPKIKFYCEVHSKVNSVEELDAADKAATEKIEAIKASLGI